MKRRTAHTAARPATHAHAARAAKSQPNAKTGRQDALAGKAGQLAHAGQPRVYSYTRFSSPEQAKGDSERRQWEAAQAYAKEKGFVFDESLRMTDRGLSGYHGTHRKKGALGAFLEKVESGAVVPGSVLVVENIDRLGRESVTTALSTILLGLLEHGITVQTLHPRHTYTRASVDDHDAYMLIGEIKRARTESERKSQLAQANWRQKRKLATEKILTGRAPAWLRVVKGKFEVIPEAAATVREIFKLKLAGNGKRQIEKKLNQSATWTPGKGWWASYIEKILRTRAVIGEFQPHTLKDGKRVPEGEPIVGYFGKAIVEPKTFYAVQKRMSGNQGKGGRTGKATNVFQNLVKCAYCGGSMDFVDKGKKGREGGYLVCTTGRRGLRNDKGERRCSPFKVYYAEFQDTLLDNLAKLRPETVLPNQDEAAKQAKQLRDAIAGLDGELADVESQIENFVDQVGATAERAMRERYEKRIAGLEAKKVELAAEHAKKETALRDLERGAQDFDKWQKDLNGLKQAIAKDVDTRIRLRAHLKEFIKQVDVFATGHADEVEYAEDLVAEFMPKLERSKAYPAFRRYLRKRLRSSDAPCFVLHLHSARPDSAGVQIAPSSSLSGGVSIRPGKYGWKFSGPKLDTLLKEFFDGRKPGFVPKASVV